MELVEGCRLRCGMCGVAGIREPGDHSLGLADPQMPVAIARQLKKLVWMSSVVLNGRGDPCMHPKLDWIVEKTRPAMTYDRVIRLHTAGVGLLNPRLVNDGPIAVRVTNRLVSLFESGVTHIIMHRRPEMAHIWGVVDSVAEDVCGLLDARLERGYLTSTVAITDRVLCMVRDVSRSKSAMERAWSGAGAGFEPPPITNYKGQVMHRVSCVRPTKEMVVRYDGTVVACQEDWRGEVVVGNVHQSGIRDIWYSETMRALRRRALAGLRDLRPCSGCEYSSDKRELSRSHGMARLPLPRDADTIRAALALGPATRPVLRPWESGTGLLAPASAPSVG